MAIQKLKVLDCTLRDGGFYNQWDFSADVAHAYFSAMAAAHVDLVEIGYRYLAKNQFLGPYAYSTDSFIMAQNLPKGPTYCVMANAKELIDLNTRGQELSLLFNRAEASPVKLVRIAAHINEVRDSIPSVQDVSNLGYRIGYNFMQIGMHSNQTIIDAIKSIVDAGVVEVLYFADSLGNMNVDDIKKIVALFQKHWNGEIGIHTHDNKCNALANTLCAIAEGVTWVDSTVLGMGRGAGNLRSEFLLVELMENYQLEKKYNPRPVVELALRQFRDLQQKHQWGANPLYFMAACRKIHPTYVQELMALDHLDVANMVDGIEILSEVPSHNFAMGTLKKIVAGDTIESQSAGSCNPNEFVKGRNVLVIGGGDGAVHHSQGIANFIRERDLFVISLNLATPVSKDLVDAYAACNNSRIVTDWQRYKNLERKIILPLSNLPENLKADADGIDVIDYCVNITATAFAAPRLGAGTVPASLAAYYAFAFAIAGGAKQIYLAGFDGFRADDPRQLEMMSHLETYRKSQSALPLVAVTPTSYPVQQASVYEPAGRLF